MTFKWPHGPGHYSYDIGGMLHGGDIDGDIFAAECKKYTNSHNNQGSEYREFLAKCYSTDLATPAYHNHYMWITWHPFSVSDWATLTSEEYVKRSVLKERARVLGIDDESKAETAVNADLVRGVSAKLWVWVLSDRQESLVITPENRKLIYGQAAEDYAL